jgi:hypothetical protein
MYNPRERLFVLFLFLSLQFSLLLGTALGLLLRLLLGFVFASLVAHLWFSLFWGSNVLDHIDATIIGRSEAKSNQGERRGRVAVATGFPPGSAPASCAMGAMDEARGPKATGGTDGSTREPLVKLTQRPCAHVILVAKSFMINDLRKH